MPREYRTPWILHPMDIMSHRPNAPWLSYPTATVPHRYHTPQIQPLWISRPTAPTQVPQAPRHRSTGTVPGSPLNHSLFPHFSHYFLISCIIFPFPALLSHLHRGHVSAEGTPAPCSPAPQAAVGASPPRAGVVLPQKKAGEAGGLSLAPWPHGNVLLRTQKWIFFPKIKKKTPSCRPPSGRARRGSAPLSLSPQGPVTMEESTQGVLRVLAGLSASSNGTFWDWRGQRLPW